MRRYGLSTQYTTRWGIEFKRKRRRKKCVFLLFSFVTHELFNLAGVRRSMGDACICLSACLCALWSCASVRWCIQRLLRVNDNIFNFISLQLIGLFIYHRKIACATSAQLWLFSLHFSLSVIHLLLPRSSCIDVMHHVKVRAYQNWKHFYKNASTTHPLLWFLCAVARRACMFDELDHHMKCTHNIYLVVSVCCCCGDDCACIVLYNTRQVINLKRM